jgi:FAD/FMN-containing dehydrogenase
MDVIRSGDPRYDEARVLFNVGIDRRPAVIAPCATAADVAEALRMARDGGLAVAVRAGGHSVAGFSTNDGGLVIDVRPMKDIRVDPDNRTVTVGAGVTWGTSTEPPRNSGWPPPAAACRPPASPG